CLCNCSKNNIPTSVYEIREVQKPKEKKKEKLEKKKQKPTPSPSPEVDYLTPQQPPSNKVLAVRQIQAWCRGTRVRRTLLHAALSVWVIQCWWRKTLAKMLEKRRLASLRWLAVQTRACITIQSWVSMSFIRQRYYRLLTAVHVIQMSWRWHNCHTRGFFQGSYELTGDQLSLRLDIFLGSQICRISDCVPFPIKN
uniref:IQ motif containing F4 n=1 Tax=Nannospalax galili TaxID=1026970 RepID=A0A8C6RJ73_NANGA